MIAPPGLKRVVLHPGDHCATVEPALISTLLGSCVAACLYDSGSGVAGMNHFLLANRRYARNMPMSITDAGRYGVHAMELLINDMLKLGACRRGIRAKVFGGGSVVEPFACDNFDCVGDVNGRFMLEFLKTEDIPLEASDLGGKLGRVIRFRTDTFAVYRKYIAQGTTAKVEQKEHRYWEREIQSHRHQGDTIVFFDT